LFRKFKFEESIYEKLQKVPLSTQFKVDRVGIRLRLKSWNRFSKEERQVLCHLPVRSQGELECYKEYLSSLLRGLREKIEWLDPPAPSLIGAEWENLARIPEVVYLQALRLKVLLRPEDWIGMDDLERYALYRLSLESSGREWFVKALQEFLGIVIPSDVVAAGIS
jgi:hypothetical protein